MKSKTAGSSDVPVPGRSCSQITITGKAGKELCRKAAGCARFGADPCLKAVMTPPEGDCHGRTQGNKRTA